MQKQFDDTIKQQEIDKVIELVRANKSQIKLCDDGYWSRAYVVRGGEFVVKFPKFDFIDYSIEAQFLNFLNSHKLPIATQKVKWLAQDNSTLVLYGVKGTALSELKSLNLAQKSDITRQLADFLKQLHSLEFNIKTKSLKTEIENYKKTYAECSDFFNAHLTKKEKQKLDFLVNEYLPLQRENLGEKLVLCHGDIWDSNIFVDDKGMVGIIDCANAGYCDEATDFCFYDKSLRDLLLNHYGASDILKRKAELKYAMSVIVSPKYIIEIEDEITAIQKYLPLIKEIIYKY